MQKGGDLCFLNQRIALGSNFFAEAAWLRFALNVVHPAVKNPGQSHFGVLCSAQGMGEP
jgi:hypothetical protein